MATLRLYPKSPTKLGSTEYCTEEGQVIYKVEVGRSAWGLRESVVVLKVVRNEEEDDQQDCFEEVGRLEFPKLAGSPSLECPAYFGPESKTQKRLAEDVFRRHGWPVATHLQFELCAVRCCWMLGALGTLKLYPLVEPDEASRKLGITAMSDIGTPPIALFPCTPASPGAASGTVSSSTATSALTPTPSRVCLEIHFSRLPTGTTRPSGNNHDNDNPPSDSGTAGPSPPPQPTDPTQTQTPAALVDFIFLTFLYAQKLSQSQQPRLGSRLRFGLLAIQ